MFGIGETELVIIVLFGFLLFGPDKLPGMGRTIGRALRQFREAQEGFTEVVQSEVMDPLNKAMNDPSSAKSEKRAAERAAAFEEDADLEGDDVAPKRKAETFAERKARLQREKAEREAAAAAEAEAAAAAEASASEDEDATEDEVLLAPSADDADAPAEATAPAPAVEPAPAAAEPEKPDTSAAALYAMKPKKKAAPKVEEPVPVEDSAEEPAEKDVPSDAAGEVE